MNPKVGYFRRMKSYHINHHYKNVELGPSSPCCIIRTFPSSSAFCAIALLFNSCVQDLVCPQSFGTMYLALCCQLQVMTSDIAVGSFLMVMLFL
jgi:hypothetical protein